MDKPTYSPSGEESALSRGSLVQFGFILFTLVAITAFLSTALDSRAPSFDMKPRTDSGLDSFMGQDLDIIGPWGYLAPYRSAADYKEPPAGCKIDQVNILHRHGARFPELADQKATLGALSKYQEASAYLASELQFLTNYTYNLGSESLVLFGAEQSWISGAEAYARYSYLVDSNNLPFIRASLSDRVVMSAGNWSMGFFERSGRSYRPNVSVYIDEGPHSNNTLFNNNCPEAREPDVQVNTWIEVFASSIADRLSTLAIGLREGIIAKDAFYLMMMCPLESVYRRTYSPFCHIFSEKEFKCFEYALDLEQYYKTGYGQPEELGRVQGVGYVNELLARLTDKPVKDHTRTNQTLDSDPSSFPLGKKMYVDFSHDHAMVAIYSALGLFNDTPLNPSKPRHDRKWVTSDIIPFSGQMTVEKVRCTSLDRVYGIRRRGRKMNGKDGVYIRVLVNDDVQPLSFCGGDGDGLCTLSEFVASQKFSRADGDGKFFKCGYDPRD